MLERVAMVQNARNTRFPTPQFTFMAEFQGKKVKFSQIMRFHYFDLIASPQSQTSKPIELKCSMKEYKTSSILHAKFTDNWFYWAQLQP